MLRMEGQISSPPPQTQPAVVEILEPETTDILVASQTIARGSVLESGALEWIAWPDEALQDSFIIREAEPDAVARATALAATQEISAGDPIRWTRLEPPRPGNLSARLPPGKRAVAVSVSVVSTAGGFVLPDDRVDVIHTDIENGEAVSRIVATNVRVIAVNQSISHEDTVLIGQTATLELNADQVAAVTAAELSGRISLALRSTDDSEESSGVYEPPTTPRSITIISNGRVQTVPLTQ